MLHFAKIKTLNICNFCEARKLRNNPGLRSFFVRVNRMKEIADYGGLFFV